MKIKFRKWKKILASPVTTMVMFVLAAVLLLGSSIGGTRAALTYFSENYTSRVQMQNIGVSLVENGQIVSWRDYGSSSNGSWNENEGKLLSRMLADGESFKLGKTYREELAVTNSGTIDQYVRVTIYKYWINGSGEKVQTLSPELIDLHLVNGGVWIVDPAASTRERTVLYYNHILSAGATTPALCDTLTVSDQVAAKVTQTTSEKVVDGIKYTTITTSYDYNGVQFQIEAKVDAVQTHSAEDAIWSAWGRRVNVGTDGVLSLR